MSVVDETAPAPRPGRRRPQPRAQRDDVATRRVILEAALEQFSQHGFEGASIAGIAAVARSNRVSSPLIHYYFKNKDELWRETIAFGLGDVLHNLQEVIDDLEGVGHLQRLRFLIKRYIAIIADKLPVFQIIIRESEIPGPRLSWLAETYLSKLYAMVVGIIESAQVAGEIKAPAPPYHLAQIIVGACYHFLGSRNRMLETYGVDVLSREVRDLHTGAVLDILFTGLLTQKAAGEQPAPESAAVYGK